MVITVERKKREKTVSWTSWDSSKRTTKGSYFGWCVLQDGKILCECQSRGKAELIASAMKYLDHAEALFS